MQILTLSFGSSLLCCTPVSAIFCSRLDRTSKPCICRRLLCCVVGFRCCDHQRSTSWRNHFLLSISLRLGLLCLSHDHGCSIGRCPQIHSIRSHLDHYGFSCPRCGIPMVDSCLFCIHWAIYCWVSTSTGCLSSLVLLHVSGLDDSSFLEGTSN